MSLEQSRFLRACRRLEADRTPVWFMRQAGRSLPEYRALRERYGFIELARQPELAAEVTLQPVRRLGVDAAILFADIMTPLLGVGLGIELVENVGPVLAQPIREQADLAALRPLTPEEDIPATLETIRLLKAELGERLPLIGFAGAPFTLASYLVEGRSSRTFARVKSAMYAAPEFWHGLMERLADLTLTYLTAQIHAGADAIQLFDSWVGCLSPEDYSEYVQPYTRRVLRPLRELGVPVIHFGTETTTLLGAMREDGGTVLGIDWRIALDEAWQRIGPELAVQGNLEPAVLLGPWEMVERRARDVLARADGRRGHIFNLGHGILPGSHLDNLARLVELVHAYELPGSPARPPAAEPPDGRSNIRPYVRPVRGGAEEESSIAGRRTGVLLMSYGTPEQLDEVPAYYTHIRGGRAPSPELVEDLRERYRRIGGSPLLRTTRELVSAVQVVLDRERPGGFDVRVGMKHWHPYIKDAVAGLAAAQPDAIVAVVLAPHYSKLSVETYHQAVEKALETSGSGVAVRYVESWHAVPGFRRMIAARITEALAAFPAAARGEVVVVFSAHSLPERILGWNDPYPAELRASADSIAAMAGVERWRLAYQSAGKTGEPWLGPDLSRELETVAAEGVRGVLSVPFGFVADHLEVLYDVDVDARERAERLGITLRRIRLPNADAEFAELLARIVLQPGLARERVAP